eukprot:scaffold707_cov399-Prasinococcus_capsulatus_cf.AAC.37
MQVEITSNAQAFGQSFQCAAVDYTFVTARHAAHSPRAPPTWSTGAVLLVVNPRGTVREGLRRPALAVPTARQVIWVDVQGRLPYVRWESYQVGTVIHPQVAPQVKHVRQGLKLSAAAHHSATAHTERRRWEEEGARRDERGERFAPTHVKVLTHDQLAGKGT